NQGRGHLLATGGGSRENLLQRAFQLPLGHKPLEFGANNPLAVHDEDPRLSDQAPFLDGWKHFLIGKILPNLLVNEGHSFAIGWQQCTNDIDDWPAHAAGTELRRCKDNELRLSLRDRVNDSNLMQARIGPQARIDLTQILDVASNEIT